MRSGDIIKFRIFDRCYFGVGRVKLFKNTYDIAIYGHEFEKKLIGSSLVSAELKLNFAKSSYYHEISVLHDFDAVLIVEINATAIFRRYKSYLITFLNMKRSIRRLNIFKEELIKKSCRPDRILQIDTDD